MNPRSQESLIVVLNLSNKINFKVKKILGGQSYWKVWRLMVNPNFSKNLYFSRKRRVSHEEYCRSILTSTHPYFLKKKRVNQEEDCRSILTSTQRIFFKDISITVEGRHFILYCLFTKYHLLDNSLFLFWPLYILYRHGLIKSMSHFSYSYFNSSLVPVIMPARIGYQ